MRPLSDVDARRVKDITDGIWQHRSGKIGDAHLAAWAGWSWAFPVRDRTRSKIRALMPHVVFAFTDQHPGYSILRPGDGLVIVTTEPDRVQVGDLGRLRKAVTALQRTNASNTVIRQHSVDPAQHRYAAEVEFVTRQAAAVLAQVEQEVARTP